MFSPDDTIVAIATPPGRGGIGVVRISGPDAVRIAHQLIDRAAPLEPRRAVFAHVSQGSSHDSIADEVVVTCFPAPHSYTGQDVAEVSAHGNPVVLRGIVRRVMDLGARLATPGEFTLRSFLNGKRDLIQAEAVADLISAVTPLQARTAFDQLDGTLTRRIGDIDSVLFDLIARLEASLDFPDEGYHFIGGGDTAHAVGRIIDAVDELLADGRRGRLIREGVTVAIVGRPNVGKSSVFNLLVGTDRAIVTEIPGTTRDLVTETIDLGGMPVRLVDTAGARETFDPVEREGVARGERAATIADLVVVVLDQSEPMTADDGRLLVRTAHTRRVVVANKSDRPDALSEENRNSVTSSHGARASVEATPAIDVRVSALTGSGVEELRLKLIAAVGANDSREQAAVSNARHIALLESARKALVRARDAASSQQSEEFVLADLQEARVHFEEIVGTRTNEAILQHIFERFCIGK